MPLHLDVTHMDTTAFTSRLRDLVARGESVVALTGAGISAESGIATFRGQDGLWENQRLEDVATPAGFRRDPRRVWEWYEGRRAQVLKARPNAGHVALGRLAQPTKVMTNSTTKVESESCRLRSRSGK